MNSWTMKQRLVWGFGFLLAIGLALGINSVITLNGINRTLDELVNDRMVKLRLFNEIKDNMQDTSRYLRDYVITDEAARKADIKKKLDDNGKETNGYLEQLDKHYLFLVLGKLWSV
ncbi:MCP four helix bundle domain-containing protein [Curvibacter sp. CHRR-16]|uniref:MCP four helix bundle domain-containing protein n=1 Tax=Curvibacter sp. CHRR-16 TaxID=2835872 RepID=UPI001BD98675|nr:MCP four helix bundle domain-containing protein [Curvibacter sp. CHRR-16]MBT0569844.1 MCP four helix bundle domain-containing protein [Curvibacter sp. CHRR-16]